ncbi:MAG: ribose-phosphate pyrophosphokinase [Candidatus Krumholzibacteriales bacterium]
MNGSIVLISGSANPALSESIAGYLDMELCKVETGRFSDGEIRVVINENIRGKDVFIIQPTFPPADNLMELLIMIDACYRASARRITAVIPYYGYGRQDRKDKPRVPISAKLVCNLLETAGAHRVLAFELHAAQIQGFFDIQVDNLFATPVFLEYIKGKNLKDVTVVSPDVGGIKLGRSFAKKLNAKLAIVDKRRARPDSSNVMNIIGDVSGKDIIILDDIISTAGTITQAASALRSEGARRITAVASHPVFSGDALEKLNDSPIEEVVVTNSIPFDDFDLCGKVRVVDLSELLGKAIMRIHNEESISVLFE